MKSTFRTLFYLKKNQPKSNGLVPIVVRVTLNSQVVQFGCKLDVNPAIWDTKAGKAVGRSKEVAEINTALDNFRVAIGKSYDKQMEDYGYAIPEKIRNQVLGLEKGAKYLVEYIDLHNQQYENRVGINTTRTTFIRYQLVKERIQDFLKLKYNVSDIPVFELTPVFVEKFFLFLRNTHNCSNNTALKFIQRFRAVFYYIKNTGADIKINPFGSFKFRTTNTLNFSFSIRLYFVGKVTRFISALNHVKRRISSQKNKSDYLFSLGNRQANDLVTEVLLRTAFFFFLQFGNSLQIDASTADKQLVVLIVVKIIN